MAVSRIAKIDAEIERTRAKVVEFQGKLKELEQKRRGVEDMEIVDIVRGLRIPLDQLAAMLQSINGGTGNNVTGNNVTSGQSVPKSAPVNKDKETEDETE